ncbi:hypothetical protein NEOC65_000678 [Neochlamydia sp. AcF65]|nr:hypothetical protein [Neochlamydia sp. AcF65]
MVCKRKYLHFSLFLPAFLNILTFFSSKMTWMVSDESEGTYG